MLSMLLGILLICTAQNGAQTDQDDPYSVRFVQNNLQIAKNSPGVTFGPVVSGLQRLGDGVSIALLKILEERDLKDPKTIKAFLHLIRQSFSGPSIISVELNKKPKVTLFLLKYVEQAVSDSELKREVRETIEYVERQSASPEQH